MSVEIGVLIREEGVVVGLRVKIGISGVVQRDPAFLLLSPSDILDRVSAPHLSFLDYSSRWNNAVRCNDGSLLQDSTLKDNRVVADVYTFLDGAGVKRAIVLDHVVSLDEQLRPESGGRVGCGMQDAVVANTDVADQPKSS